MPLWVEISWKVSGLGASEETEVGGNYVCCLVIVVILLGPKRQRFFKVIIRREGEKPQTRGVFMGCRKKTTQVVDHWTTLSGINYYFSLFCCKKIYALHKIRSYKNLIGKVWINFSSWIYFYLHYWFFLSICKWQLNEHLLFLTLP